jgi:alkyl hydroperoxide reductase subunit AhpF
MCPAHSAGFSLVSGAPESAPGLDGIPTFPVFEKEGKFFVEVPAGKLPGSVPQPLSKRDPLNTKNYVIIGGGAAGLNAAETLRQSGYTGQITLICREASIPYDRTLITKALAVGDSSKWSLRPEEYLKNADIEYKLKSSAFNINTEKSEVVLTSGEHIHYDKLLIATGSTVVKPNIPGINSKGVHIVRTNLD